MKMMSDDDVLNLEFRKNVLAEIKGTENVRRKNEHLRRYEVYKDQTVKWVLESLKSDGLEPETIAMMTNRASNVSICKKIVNKLARTYSGGVQRSVGDDADARAAVDAMARYLQFDDKMKKNDRYRELQRNSVAQFLQERSGGDAETPLYRVGMRILGPWQYDVIEDCFNRETARCYILSDFIEQNNSTPNAGTNLKDDVIADAPTDAGMGKRRTFIWWTAKYHFTTWDDGTFCEEMTEFDGDSLPLNPIGILPFVNNAEEQDGQFWAQGGEDIADGSILVNKIITDMFFIQMLQGFGLLVITGKNLKDKYKVGPNQAILLEQEEDGPTPTATFASSNPPLEMWMRAVEQYLALLLTTNNLSVAHVAGKLDVVNFPSGIAAIVEMSEVTMETEDKFSQYAQQEREAFKIIQAWQEYLLATDEADPEFRALPELPADIGMTLTTRFTSIKPVMTESEKLQNLKTRKELGINEEVDLIMMDNPDMTREDAEKKLLAIKKVKLKAAADMAAMMARNAAPEGQDEENTDDATEDDNAV